MTEIQRFHIDGIVVDQISGEVDAAGAREVMLQTLREPGGCLLVDCSASRHRYGFSDAMRLMDEAGALPEAQQKRIALVNTFLNRSELTLFMADQGRREGLEVRAFFAFDEAVAWLEEACGGDDDAPASVSARRAPAR